MVDLDLRWQVSVESQSNLQGIKTLPYCKSKYWKNRICCGSVKRDVLVAAVAVVTCGCEAAPWASMINAYLPSLGSGVPFLLLYPAAPTAEHRTQGDVCSSVCFLPR